MQVHKVMANPAKFCHLETTLGEAAEMLRANVIGSLPIVDRARTVVGIICDRDICLAVGAAGKNARTKVEELALPKLFCCQPGDEIHAAMVTMAVQKVPLLAVVDQAGKLRGVLAMGDIVRRAVLVPKEVFDITYEDVMNTLKAIYEPASLGAERAG